MKTKQKIIIRALEQFNLHGIEYTSLLKLGEPLNLKSGHISCHFPKKDDLINVLALQFSEKNNLLWQKKEEINLKSFFDLLKSHFQQQLEYRCLFISFAHLQKHHPEIAERNKKEEEVRKKVIGDFISAMMKNGEIKNLSKNEKGFLINTILLITKSWISEAVISHPYDSEEKQINYFLGMIRELLK